MINVQNTLRHFGITRCYKGFHQASYSIWLALNDEMRLHSITQQIYMETAVYFNCKWTAVERNIRTAAARAWNINPDLLCQMAGYPLSDVPTASEFIEIITSYLLRNPQN